MKNELIELLREWVDLNNEPCKYDQHGYCREHYAQEDCIVKRTRAAIVKERIPDDPITNTGDVINFCNLLIDADKCLNFIKKAMEKS